MEAIFAHWLTAQGCRQPKTRRAWRWDCTILEPALPGTSTARKPPPLDAPTIEDDPSVLD